MVKNFELFVYNRLQALEPRYCGSGPGPILISTRLLFRDYLDFNVEYVLLKYNLQFCHTASHLCVPCHKITCSCDNPVVSLISLSVKAHIALQSHPKTTVR